MHEQNRDVNVRAWLEKASVFFKIALLLLAFSWATSASSAIPPSERAALLSFYQSTNGNSWYQKSNWNGPPGTECTWFQVGCDANQTTVIWIDVEWNNLTGSIPDLSGLPNLQEFYVFENHISGVLPSLTSLSKLTIFEVDHNNLTGAIPDLSALANLQVFRANKNNLSGSVPSIQGLSALQTFDVRDNGLTGTIPALTGLSQLLVYEVGGNQLTGQIPSLAGLSGLAWVDFSRNQLGGAMPTFYDSPLLVFLDVETNQLTGEIPSLSAFTNLQYFFASSNKLTGSIPTLAGLNGLTYFEASNNRLTGSLPSLDGLKNLNDFEVSSNQLTGSIPSLNGLSNLQTFYVDNNQLSGGLPAAPHASSNVCPNPLTPTPDPAWDSATGVSPWYQPCIGSPSTVTPSAGPNGTIAPNTPVVVQSGRTSAFRVIPNAGYVAVVGGTCGPNNAVTTGTISYSTAPILTDCTVAATFAPLPYVGKTSVVATPTTIVGNQTVALTATVSGVSPTGTVTFYVGSSVVCVSYYLSANQTAYCKGTFGGAGQNIVTATYSGDSLNASSSGTTAFNYIVQQSIQLSTSNNLTYVGQPITFSASLNPFFNGTFGTGTITFSDGETTLCVVQVINLSALCTTTSVLPGTRTITAVYSGDSVDTPATNTIVQNVSATLFDAKFAVSMGSNPMTVSETAVFRASLNGGDSPTGAVSFFDNGKLLCNQIFDTGVFPPQATCLIAANAPSALTKGYHLITAVYTGDAYHAPSSISFTLIVGDSLIYPRIQFTASSYSVYHGQSVNLVATVVGTAPSGTLTFSFSGEDAVCRVPLVATTPTTSTATCTAALQSPGDEITANYSGDINNYTAVAQQDVLVNPSQGSFVSVQPFRLLDTRPGGITGDALYSGAGPLQDGSKLDLLIAGRAGIPSTNVSAVVFNMTATDTTASGYLTAWPAGQPLPASSNLNFTQGQTVPNLVVVPIGAFGSVSLYNSAGSTNVIADAVGYFTSASELNALTPQRVMDTRASYQTIDGKSAGIGSVQAGETIDLILQGRAGVPNFGAGTALLNVTVTNPTQPGFATVYAGGAARPLASNLNFLPNETVANLVVAPVSDSGVVSLYNSAGTTDFIVDLIGWVPSVSQLTPLSPARLLDTRTGASTIDGKFVGIGPVGAGKSIALNVLGRGGIPTSGVDSVVLNVTATNPTADGYITVWPSLTPQPFASNLNFTPHESVPNLVIAKLGADGTVSLFNSAGTTDLVVDVVGWFSGSP